MIRHLINIFKPSQNSDLVRALPVTVASMVRAQKNAEMAGLQVELRAAAFEHEQDCIPEHFTPSHPLERCCWDIEKLSEFPPLPFHRDLIERLAEGTNDDDLLIYTNSDIGVQPHFYKEVQGLHDSGLDAFIINRRTVGDHYAGVSDLEQIYLDKGKPHPGADCFVFKANLVKAFEFVDVVVGTALFDKMLLWNMVVFELNYAEIKDAYLTFHLGNDMAWKDLKTKPLREHNRRELGLLLERLESRLGNVRRCKRLWNMLTARVNSPKYKFMYELVGFTPKKRRLLSWFS